MNIIEDIQHDYDSRSWFVRFIRDHGIRPYSLWGNFRHPIETIRFQWYCFYYGICNIVRFWRVVWRFDTCDYTGLLELMQAATKQMAIDHRDHGHLVNSERTAHQLFIVSELCRRLAADDYFDLAEREGRKDADWSKRVGYLGKQDAEYLGRMFRHVQTWWD